MYYFDFFSLMHVLVLSALFLFFLRRYYTILNIRILAFEEQDLIFNLNFQLHHRSFFSIYVFHLLMNQVSFHQ